jgi:hypothetical protein
MNKQLHFKNLIDLLDKECSKDHSNYKYIGTGNPDADILIIGKEASISKEQGDQLNQEFKSNFEHWKTIVKTGDFDQSKIKDCDCVYRTPLYPYKGQLLKINNGNNSGTSRTWYNYQKLINEIFNTPKNEKIDFHEKVFITETNSTPCKRTKNADTLSIEFRKDKFLRSEFFQSFPIVILAGLGYYEIDENNNEVETVYGVKFTEKRLAGGKESQPYWIHYSKDPKKILINTRQLSINVSDALLQEVALAIREWMTQEKIDLSL